MKVTIKVGQPVAKKNSTKFQFSELVEAFDEKGKALPADKVKPLTDAMRQVTFYSPKPLGETSAYLLLTIEEVS